MTYGPYWPASELTPAQSRAERILGKYHIPGHLMTAKEPPRNPDRIDKIIDEVRTANAEAVFDFGQRKQGRE